MNLRFVSRQKLKESLTNPDYATNHYYNQRTKFFFAERRHITSSSFNYFQ